MTFSIQLWGEGERPRIAGGRVKITKASIFKKREGAIVYVGRVRLEKPHLKKL